MSEPLKEGTPLDVARPDAAITSFDRQVYESLRKVLLLPGDFLTYMDERQKVNQQPVSVNQIVGRATGSVYDRVAITSTVNVTATSEATANTVVTADPVVFDGLTDIRVRFYASRLEAGTGLIFLILYDGAGSVGEIGIHNVAGKAIPVDLGRIITPSAGSHTFSIRAYVDAGTGKVIAGAGGSGTPAPSYIEISKA